ncbi:MAG: hypothetical protein PVG93_00085 [Phycisphaerales bacterium]|jgi:hypothetical protein
MNLIKWIRRNERKILAVVVIILMVGFIGGSYLSQLGRGGFGRKTVIARYGVKGKITDYDRALAQRDLDLLQSLRMDQMLRGQDLRGVFLAELLFSEGRTSPELLVGLKRAIAARKLRVSDGQIAGLYRHTVPSDIYWILLKREAAEAGVSVSSQVADRILGSVLPQLFNGATYSQVISGLRGRGLSEEMIREAFSELLAVLEYARIIISVEGLTELQMRSWASLEGEEINTELVKFNASVFADRQPEPSSQQVREQFENFKSNLAGELSNENPYGFGYMLDNMAALEYIALKMDDISATVEKPTQQEMEDFYQAHPEQFVEQIPIDPNDPNSPMTERVVSFGRVAKLISDRIYQQRISTKVDVILGDAKLLAQENFGEADVAELGAEKLEELAVDYTQVAERLSRKYGIRAYSGKTGLLSADDMRVDEYLSGLFLRSRSAGQIPTSLSQLVFSVESFSDGSTGLQQSKAIKMYEDIGPVLDVRGRIVAMVRVIETKEAADPNSLEQSFSKVSIVLDESNEMTHQSYSAKDEVVEDLRNLTAMKTARQMAEEFAELAAKLGWEAALERFNGRFGSSESEPNTFEMTDWQGLKRYSDEYMETLAFRSKSEFAAKRLMDQSLREAKIIEKLYSLIPADSNQPAELPLVVKMEPDMSYYLVKELSVSRIYNDEYLSSKPMWAYGLESVEGQNLVAVHFQPDNILKRMNFRPEKETEARQEPIEPVEDIIEEVEF